MIDTDKLEALAAKARKVNDAQHWRANSQGHVIATGDGCIGEHNIALAYVDVAEYIAAANPDFVLEMVNEIYRLRRKLERYVCTCRPPAESGYCSICKLPT